MKKLFKWFTAVACVTLFFVGCSTTNTRDIEQLSIIPYPDSVAIGKGTFTFSPQTLWVVENKAQENIALQIIEKFNTSSGFSNKVSQSEKQTPNSVFFQTDGSIPEEAYYLRVTKKGVTIKASSHAGFFYATQTLRQLLPPEIESATPLTFELKIPALTIIDKPRFRWRGFMLDVSRHFMPKAYVLGLIDNLAFHKINIFHLHLVDDNGWRIEIKKYPELTEVGARRVERNGLFTERTLPGMNEPTVPTGFYTQEDIKEMAQYAAQRNITIIPEIEMPAHTTSSLAAYPELACPGAQKPIQVQPGPGNPHTNREYCAGNEQVFAFLEDVLAEVMELFPSPYIHIGGDEASKRDWKQCDLCQKRMKEEGLPNEEELQGYFIRRMGKYIKDNGREWVGWDEITNSKMPEEAIVMGWRGNGNAGYKAGELGHRFVMSPARSLYFIRYQGPQWFEPTTYFENVTLKDVYEYEPLPDSLDVKVAKNLLGVEACLWTEFVTNPKEADYMTYPRLDALAEVAWTSKKNRNFEAFLPRLDVMLKRYQHMQIDYAKSMFNIGHQAKPVEGVLEVSLACERPDIKIEYSIASEEGVKENTVYTGSILLHSNAIIKAKASTAKGVEGKELVLDLQFNKATAKTIVFNNSDGWILANGLRGSEKHTDGEWIGCYGENAEILIDLHQPGPITNIKLGTIQDLGMGITFPSLVKCMASADGALYEMVGTLIPGDLKKVSGVSITEFEINNLALTARYIKLVAEKNEFPKGFWREGTNSWIKFDEIIVN